MGLLLEDSILGTNGHAVYYKDLDPYSYELGEGRAAPGTACIGWIEPDDGFVADPDWVAQNGQFLAALRDLVITWPVNRTRGTHACGLCGDGEDIYLPRDGGRPVLLGSAEVWVPSADSGLVYVAPDLVFHYVDVHHYRPPPDFVQAVVNARQTYAAWNPETECDRLIRAAFEGE